MYVYYYYYYIIKIHIMQLFKVTIAPCRKSKLMRLVKIRFLFLETYRRKMLHSREINGKLKM